MFKKFGFKLEIQSNLKVTDYLDITLDLHNGTISPFRKNNQQPCYIDVGSNHPTHVLKHIPNGISYRLSTNSSSDNILNQNKQDYEKGLENSGHKSKLIYIDTHNSPNTQGKHKNRARKILWFNLPTPI